jgi:hypothetical protein
MPILRNAPWPMCSYQLLDGLLDVVQKDGLLPQSQVRRGSLFDVGCIRLEGRARSVAGGAGQGTRGGGGGVSTNQWAGGGDVSGIGTVQVQGGEGKARQGKARQGKVCPW